MGKKIGSVLKTIANVGTGGLLGSIAPGVFGEDVPDGGDGPKGLPAGGPVGPKPDMTPQELATRRSSITQEAESPGFLGLSPLMTPLQKRTAIATGGVSGEGESYTDPESVKYYQRLGLGSVNDYSEIMPIEHEYLKRLGQEPRSKSLEGFFSALDRALGV